MTHEQIYKLQKAMELINDSIGNTNMLRPSIKLKIISTWLSVAGDYCKQVAEELKG